MRFSIVIAALAAAVAASPMSSPHMLHEKRESGFKRWVKRAPVPAHAVLPFRIGLVQSNLDKMHDLLMEVSDMDSPKYGQHYTAEEVDEIFKPSQESVDTVRNWLEASGIAPHRVAQTVNKQWLAFDASVKEAEALFKTKYHAWQHQGTGNENIGCEEYHLPAHVRDHVDYVTPGVRMLAGSVGGARRRNGGFPTEIEKRNWRSGHGPWHGPIIIGPAPMSKAQLAQSNNAASDCDIAQTPNCIATMYNITKPTTAYAGNQLGIFEEGDFYRADDLVEFFENLAPQIPSDTRPHLDSIDGGTAPSATAGGESDLDLQISYPIIYPQTEILYQTDDIFYATGEEGGNGFLNTFFDAIDGSYCNYSAFGETGDSPIDPVYPDPNPAGYQGQLMCGKYKPTHVISISYGEQEDDVPTNYQQRQCSEVGKLAMRGTTVVVSSGDSGVADEVPDDGNKDGCLGAKGEVFNPDFPTTCPYIVSAGATYLPLGAQAGKDQEVAVTRFPSGGGFSNVYPRPSYQDTAVTTYLDKYVPKYKYYTLKEPNANPNETLTAGGLYNRGGRGYPDISAIGDNVVIVLNGAPTLIGGTSASAPVIASIFNRINEERLAKGMSTIGWVHPTIYKHPEAFHDITVGNNSGCNTMGFVASKGWDPVTGLGTPNYPALLKVFLGS